MSRTAPADLYSNCTIALDPQTGKLIWYYQHLPADDWDTDHTHERTLVTTTFNPDPKAVKWYNTTVPLGSKHDVAAMVGESGMMFVLDRNDGKFLWAEPVPVDAPNMAISNIDRKTGADHDQLGRGDEKAGRSPRDLLLERPQLLADGVRSGNEFALHLVRG